MSEAFPGKVDAGFPSGNASSGKPDYSLVRPVLGEAAVQGAVTVAEEPYGMVTLRADLSDARVGEAIAAVTGDSAMPEIRRMNGVDPHSHVAAWMAPDELLLFVPYEEATEIVSRLTTDLSGVHHLAVNVSDARAHFTLTGNGARGVLAKGAPVDLAAGAFGVGDFRRTRIGLVAAAFYMSHDDPEKFGVVCFRSYARHMWDWLVASAKRPVAL